VCESFRVGEVVDSNDTEVCLLGELGTKKTPTDTAKAMMATVMVT
jgi:hypothetical protein